MIAFVVSKKENYNFYDNDINKHLEAIYANYEYERRVKKQIIIQFKKYDRYDASHKDELQEIINYKKW